jgi:hypothetical protein
LRRHDPNAGHYARGNINAEQLQVCTLIDTVLNYSITLQLARSKQQELLTAAPGEVRRNIGNAFRKPY